MDNRRLALDGDFHVVVLGGRGERLDGGETDLAQVGLGLLTREVIGIAQGLDQTLDLLRGGRSGGQAPRQKRPAKPRGEPGFR